MRHHWGAEGSVSLLYRSMTQCLLDELVWTSVCFHHYSHLQQRYTIIHVRAVWTKCCIDLLAELILIRLLTFAHLLLFLKMHGLMSDRYMGRKGSEGQGSIAGNSEWLRWGIVVTWRSGAEGPVSLQYDSMTQRLDRFLLTDKEVSMSVLFAKLLSCCK